MAENSMDSLRGHFLTAMPLLMDPNFKNTVTCICEHGEKGAMGIIVNRLFPNLSAGTIFKELEIGSVPEADNQPIYVGGPVHPNEMFILHGPPFGWQGTFMVTSTLALSNSIDLLSAIAMGHGPLAYFITLGSAGWAPGQLEMELQENAWLTSPVSDEVIFSIPIEKRWNATLAGMGINPAGLSDRAGHA